MGDPWSSLHAHANVDVKFLKHCMCVPRSEPTEKGILTTQTLVATETGHLATQMHKVMVLMNAVTRLLQTPTAKLFYDCAL